VKQIHTLTGLRGLAALIVFIDHSATESLLPRFLGHGFGQIGVMLFFVLSGFLMAHLYVHEIFDRQNVSKYAFARIGRVIPLYLLLLLLSVAISLFISPESFYPYKFYKLKYVATALLMIDAKYVFWTIPVEVQFYVLFVGFWALYKKGYNGFYLLAFSLITLVPAVIVYALFSKLPKFVSTYSYAFFLGVATALLLERIKHNRIINKYSTPVGAVALVLLFLNLPEIRLEYGLVLGEREYFRTWLDPLTWTIVYVVFLCAVMNSRGLSLLSGKFFMGIGKISYGFYLIHYPVLMFFVREVNAPDALKFTGAFLGAAAISYLSFYLFEKPMANKIRRFGHRTSNSANASRDLDSRHS
jgi:peptidoglycan/LPS O-acetylase OafA/YrhL